MVWGASFSLLFLILLILALIQVLIYKTFYKRNPPQFALPSSVNSEQNFSVDLELGIPFVLPGFRLRWTCHYQWEDGHRDLWGSAALLSGRTLFPVAFAGPQRGVYRGRSGTLVLEDLMGFTSFAICQGDPVTLYVYPVLKEEFDSEKIQVFGGSSATNERERVRSEELLEVRKYYPGDDARRINWKMFAATGEMFLRIGEEVPPPSGEAVVAIFPQSETVEKSPENSPMSDRLVLMLLALLDNLLMKGCRLVVLTGKGQENIVYNPENPHRLLQFLSSITAGKSASHVDDLKPLYCLLHPGVMVDRELLGRSTEEVCYYINAPVDKPLNHPLKSLFWGEDKFLDVIKFLGHKEKMAYALKSSEEDLKRQSQGRSHVFIV